MPSLALQKLSGMFSSNRLGFYNLKAELRGFLLELVELLKAVTFLVVLLPLPCSWLPSRLTKSFRGRHF
jgi:hypothetical protein